MKKYVIIIVIFAVLIWLIISFDVIDRIAIANKGMEMYNLDDYDVTSVKIGNCSVDIDMQRYVGEEVVLLEHDGLKIRLKNIEYRGDSYRLQIICEGKSNYNEGTLLSLGNFNDITFVSDGNAYIASIVGIESVIDDKVDYYLDVYSNDNISMDEIAEMKRINFELKDIELLIYERK